MRLLLFFLVACCLSLDVHAQSVRVTGKVLDAQGQPLPGAVLKVTGSTEGTVASSTGTFMLNVPGSQSHLTVSFIGYTTREIAVNGSQPLSITLSQRDKALDEVVVVAYGTQKRTSITGAVGTVDAAEIKKNSVSDIVNTITGRTPGVRITQLSSEPGKFESSIDIRGFASYGGDGVNPNQTGAPLFVIDGVPRDQSAFARLDPNEVESFSVLKDATAAIYGVKAANGVILVTTKKGSKGKMKIDYTGSWGEQIITNYPQVAGAYQYTQLYDQQQINNRESYRSDPINPMYTAAQIDAYKTGVLPSTNWTTALFKKHTEQQQHNVTISGGTDKIQYFTSLGYFKEGGLLTSNIENDQKYNLRQSVTAEVAKGLTVNLNLGLNIVKSSAPNYLTASVWNLVKADLGIPPVETVYSNGDPTYYRQFLNTLTSNDNPIALIDRNKAGYDDNKSNQFTSVLTATYLIPKVSGLSAKGLIAYDNSTSLDQNFAKAYNEYQFAGGVQVPALFHAPSQLIDQSGLSNRNDLQLSLNYLNHFGKHTLSALGLYEQISNYGQNVMASTKFLVDAIPTLDAGNRASDQVGGSYSSNANRSYVGRVNYDYAGKYIAEVGFREDGSSYFAPDKRWGFFPYASAGWRVSEEPFIKNNLKWVDNIKIRASYGKLGDDVGAANSYPGFLTGYNYPASGSVYAGGGSTVGSVFGSSGGITKGIDFKSVANTGITWYTSETADLGLETSFWNGNLTFEGDIFRRDRSGLLANRIVSIPTTFGADLPPVNLNADRTQGFELTLGTGSKIGDFTYHVSANMGYSRTQNRHFEETAATSPLDNYRNKFNNRYTDQIWGYVVTGQFQNYQQIYSSPVQDGAGNRTLLPGDLIYKDLNGDGVINNNDQKVIANGGNRPLVYFGTTIDASWKSFDISLLIQGATDYHITYQDQLGRPFYFGNSDPLAIYSDSWHRANVSDPNSAWIPGKYPAMGQRQNYKDIGYATIGSGSGVNSYVQYGNTFNVFDGTYARLKQVQIGYTLPKAWLESIGVSKVRVFATAYNLLTWTAAGLNFVDPEYTDTRLYGYNYPITMNVNFGVNVTF